MIEYIRRADALKAMDCGNLHKGIVDALQSLILDVPAADVRPVVRGEWIPVTNGRGGYECDQCHAYAPSYPTGEERLRYFCPDCGADMRMEDGNVRNPNEE